jgi:ABC-type taurine transport system ATPase subunit
LKADVSVIYGGIKVWVCVGFNIDIRDDFLLVVLGVSDGGK